MHLVWLVFGAGSGRTNIEAASLRREGLDFFRETSRSRRGFLDHGGVLLGCTIHVDDSTGDLSEGCRLGVIVFRH